MSRERGQQNAAAVASGVRLRHIHIPKRAPCVAAKLSGRLSICVGLGLDQFRQDNSKSRQVGCSRKFVGQDDKGAPSLLASSRNRLGKTSFRLLLKIVSQVRHYGTTTGGSRLSRICDTTCSIEKIIASHYERLSKSLGFLFRGTILSVDDKVGIII
jgi:hypothetical protein